MGSWADDSEVVAGLLLEGRLSPRAVRAETFLPPYDEMVRSIQAGIIQPDELMERVGVKPVNTAHNAAKSLNGLGETTDWVSLLERSAAKFSAGMKLEQIGRKMKHGEEVNITKTLEILQSAETGGEYGVRSLTEVEDMENPFIPSGWSGIDYHFGGLPMSGLTTLSGPPKIGKTTTMLRLFGKFIRFYEDKTALIFSLEMSASELKTRMKELNPTMTRAEAKRVRVYDETDTTLSKIAAIGAKEEPGIVAVDFADLLVRGSSDTSSMEEIYRTLANIAKDLTCPIILISQLNGDYRGGIPRPNNLRWTRLAEALSWMVLMIYNPNMNYYNRIDDDDELLPPAPGKAYLICWLARGGIRRHGGPGAIQMRWRSDLGFANNGDWFTLTRT